MQVLSWIRWLVKFLPYVMPLIYLFKKSLNLSDVSLLVKLETIAALPLISSNMQAKGYKQCPYSHRLFPY